MGNVKKDAPAKENLALNITKRELSKPDPKEEKELSEEERCSLIEHRKYLNESRHKSQEDYDKTVVALSGGALGVSFAFLKDIVGSGGLWNKSLLLLAWISWGLSVSAVLFSYFLSHLALRECIFQIDEAIREKNTDHIYVKNPGGKYSKLTAFLNVCGGLLFFIGVILLAYFIWSNLEAINVRKENLPSATATNY